MEKNELTMGKNVAVGVRKFVWGGVLHLVWRVSKEV